MTRFHSVGDPHTVTAGEAALVRLYCHITQEHQQGQWALAWPVYAEKRWPIRLLAFYAEVCDSGCIPKLGIPVGLYALYRPTDALFLNSTLQGYTGKATWTGMHPCEYGFGLMVRSAAVAAGDIITWGASYEL